MRFNKCLRHRHSENCTTVYHSVTVVIGINWKDSPNAYESEKCHSVSEWSLSITLKCNLHIFFYAYFCKYFMRIFAHRFMRIFHTSVLSWTSIKVLNDNRQTQMWRFNLKCDNSVWNVTIQSKMWKCSLKCDGSLLIMISLLVTKVTLVYVP